jgi:hypothetical protein
MFSAAQTCARSARLDRSSSGGGSQPPPKAITHVFGGAYSANDGNMHARSYSIAAEAAVRECK